MNPPNPSDKPLNPTQDRILAEFVDMHSIKPEEAAGVAASDQVISALRDELVQNYDLQLGAPRDYYIFMVGVRVATMVLQDLIAKDRAPLAADAALKHGIANWFLADGIPESPK